MKRQGPQSRVFMRAWAAMVFGFSALHGTLAADHPHAVVGDETELIFVGFAAFLDPPKASAKEALARLTSTGVKVKVVTGDNDLVTRHVCRQLGLPEAERAHGRRKSNRWTIRR